MRKHRRGSQSIPRFARSTFITIFPILCMVLAMCLAAVPSFAQGSGQAGVAPGGAPGGGDRLKLVRVTPAGDDVPAARRIVFEFDRPVVPLGRMERDASEVPVNIQPGLACEWRWLNPTTLSCNLGEKTGMVPSTRYRIVVKPGLAAEDGSTLGEEAPRTFVTERAKISSSWFKTWLSPGKPQLGLRFNQPVRQPSVAKHVFLQTEKGVRIPLEVTADPDFEPIDDLTRDTQWLAAPKDELPSDTAVDLKVEPGVLSESGPEAGVERRTVTAFQTFPKFSFLGVGCRDRSNKPLQIRPEDSGAAQTRCDPSRGISLLFSAPSTVDEIRQGLRITPALAAGQPDYDPWEDVYMDSGLAEPHKKGKTYKAALPPGIIKPFAQYSLAAAAGSIRDVFGRKLATPARMAFLTDHWPPDFELYRQMPVLEKALDTEAPLFATNIDRIQMAYETLTTSGRSGPQNAAIDPPKREDVTQVIPLGVRKLLGKPSGLLTGRLTSTPPVRGKEASEKWLFAQVTPFHVHVKLGHYSSLVWVTDLRPDSPFPASGLKFGRILSGASARSRQCWGTPRPRRTVRRIFPERPSWTRRSK